jgi:hypothetical protein
MKYSFQWKVLFWSVLFSAVCYGHMLSRVRTSGFGFFSQETFADSFNFGESHALVAMKIARWVAADDFTLYQDRKPEELDCERRALFGPDPHKIFIKFDSSIFDGVDFPVFFEDVVKAKSGRFDNRPVTMFSIAPSGSRFPTECADIRHARHYSPARARKQGPLVLVASAKTKSIAILKKDSYTLPCEVEELSHGENLLRFNGGSVPSLELRGVEKRHLASLISWRSAVQVRPTATRIYQPTMRRGGLPIDARNAREIRRTAPLGIAA